MSCLRHGHLHARRHDGSEIDPVGGYRRHPEGPAYLADRLCSNNLLRRHHAMLVTAIRWVAAGTAVEVIERSEALGGKWVKWELRSLRHEEVRPRHRWRMPAGKVAVIDAARASGRIRSPKGATFWRRHRGCSRASGRGGRGNLRRIPPCSAYFCLLAYAFRDRRYCYGMWSSTDISFSESCVCSCSADSTCSRAHLVPLGRIQSSLGQNAHWLVKQNCHTLTERPGANSESSRDLVIS